MTDSPAAQPSAPRIGAETIRTILRIVLFVIVGKGMWQLVAMIMPPGTNTLAVSTLSTFAGGALANALLARIFENSSLASFGMAWAKTSGRELLTGIAGGAGAGAALFLFALATRMATLESVPAAPRWALNVAFILVLLAFGAMGEELLFHGYAFQLMVGKMGEFAAVLPVAVLFGFAHRGNDGVTLLAIFNTILFGILLGYAYVRTRALWLPIGVHFGWNGITPLLGINLSGFTMGGPGYALHWNVADFWSGGAYGFEGSILTTVIVVVLFFVLRRTVPAWDGFSETNQQGLS